MAALRSLTMDAIPSPSRNSSWPLRAAPAIAAWLVAWVAMLLLDGEVDLASLAMLLVLGSAVASLWLPGWVSAATAAAAVAAFNWTFVPPRHTLAVDLHQHVLLLGAMLLVNWIVSALMIGQRRVAERARGHAEREARLRQWGDTLRDATDPAAHAGALCEALAAASGVPAALIVCTRRGAPADDDTAWLHVGAADGDQRAGLALCVREARPLGPGSGRYEEQPDVYLPMRGRGSALGAAVLKGVGHREPDADLLAHAQALCDQMGMALHRALSDREEQAVRERAQTQAVRNALLAAISHDYRTPLATIMSAASSLDQQADRLGLEQRRRLAQGIVEETERLGRLTDNTLQLARLDAPGVELRCDWESAEEIVGTVLRRVRRRDTGRRVRARLEPGLPLLWCDAMLMSQLLENLVDNALKYSPAEAPVEMLVRRVGEQVLLAVRDRGPGIAPAWRERVFDVFQRGATAPHDPALESGRAGAGVGLAVCRAIARAHGGELRLRARGHGGCAFECWLPVREPPQPPEPADTP
jgi:two-component system sensor histidine kinase KdpD